MIFRKEPSLRVPMAIFLRKLECALRRSNSPYNVLSLTLNSNLLSKLRMNHLGDSSSKLLYMVISNYVELHKYQDLLGRFFSTVDVFLVLNPRLRVKVARPAMHSLHFDPLFPSASALTVGHTEHSRKIRLPFCSF